MFKHNLFLCLFNHLDYIELLGKIWQLFPLNIILIYYFNEKRV